MPEPVPSNLTAEAAALPVTDWDAHRRFAQGAATEGYAADVEQIFTNDRADGEYMLTHRITLSPYDPQQEGGSSAISEDEGPMGDTRTVETFTPDRPEGYYGARTPWEDAPYLSPAQELASDALTRLTALNRDDPEQMSDSRLARVRELIDQDQTTGLATALHEVKRDVAEGEMFEGQAHATSSFESLEGSDFEAQLEEHGAQLDVAQREQGHLATEDAKFQAALQPHGAATEEPKRDRYAETVSARDRLFGAAGSSTASNTPSQPAAHLHTQTRTESRGREM